MKLERIVQQIEDFKPDDLDGLLKNCRFPLRYVGAGAFREVFDIVGSGMVLKMPLYGCSIRHSHREYEAWKRVMKSRRKAFAKLKAYMPVIHYFHPELGIILMDRYKEPSYRKYADEMNEVESLVFKLMPDVNEPDLGSDKSDNFGVDRSGQLKITDLGLFVSDEGCSNCSGGSACSGCSG